MTICIYLVSPKTQWPSHSYNWCAAQHFLCLLNTRDCVQVLQRTANPLTVLWGGDCFVPAVKLTQMEGCQPWEAALSWKLHGLGSSRLGSCTPNFTVGWVWPVRSAHSCQFKTQPFGHQNTTYEFPDIIYRYYIQILYTEPVSYTGMPFVCVFGWHLWCPRRKKVSEAAFVAQVLKVILCCGNMCFPSHSSLAWMGVSDSLWVRRLHL